MTESALSYIKGVYGIIDADQERDMGELLEAFLACGTKVIQLRMKDRPTDDLMHFGRTVRQACSQAGALFILNDRPDVAAAIGADGVHLGQSDVPVAAARELMPTGLIGKSTHNERQLVLAIAEGADYLGFGPIFPTRTKAAPAPVVGLKGLQAAMKVATVPVVAIGGIAIDNAKQVVAAGATAIATITAVAKAWQPKDAVRSLHRAFIVQPPRPMSRPY
jgi:thiamine-phosphate diphosphorylase